MYLTKKLMSWLLWPKSKRKSTNLLWFSQTYITSYKTFWHQLTDNMTIKELRFRPTHVVNILLRKYFSMNFNFVLMELNEEDEMTLATHMQKAFDAQHM